MPFQAFTLFVTILPLCTLKLNFPNMFRKLSEIVSLLNYLARLALKMPILGDFGAEMCHSSHFFCPRYGRSLLPIRVLTKIENWYIIWFFPLFCRIFFSYHLTLSRVYLNPCNQEMLSFMSLDISVAIRT